MVYDKVFDALETGFWRWPLFIPLLMSAVGIGLVVIERRMRSPWRSLFRRVFPYVWASAACALTVLAISTTWYVHRVFTAKLRAGQYQLVEGVVSDFRPMPREGHQLESFVVSGHVYEYSDFEEQPGFHNTRAWGGPIREGLRVRIADIDGMIARLEIAR